MNEAWTNPTTRMRRGKTVEIPPEWRGKITHQQTIQKRESKQVRKLTMRRAGHGWSKGHPKHWPPRHTPRSLAVDEDAP